MKQKLLVITGLLISIMVHWQSALNAQNSSDGSFVRVSAGFNGVKFRNMATSPLFYQGRLSHVELGLVKHQHDKERELRISLSKGNATNSFNDHTAISAISIYGLDYSRLFPVWSKSKFNLKLGGELSNRFHTRNNPSLQNNQQGLEFFSTLMLSSKLGWDISNTEEKRFFPFRFKPAKRELSFQLKTALMNNTYRNGYIYNNQSDIINNTRLFDGYEFSLFSGYRIASELNYSVFLKNGNIINLGYGLDAYKTGGDYDKFALAHHQLKISLFFKTK